MAVPTTTTAMATAKLIPRDDIENITERPPNAGRILDGDMSADHPTPELAPAFIYCRPVVALR